MTEVELTEVIARTENTWRQTVFVAQQYGSLGNKAMEDLTWRRADEFARKLEALHEERWNLQRN